MTQTNSPPQNAPQPTTLAEMRQALKSFSFDTTSDTEVSQDITPTAQAAPSTQTTPQPTQPASQPAFLKSLQDDEETLDDIADMVMTITPSPLRNRDDPFDYERPTLPTLNSVPFDQWEALAYDIALGNTPNEELCRAYEIKEESLLELRRNPYFVKVLQAKQEEVADVGENASTITKFRMISNIGLREFVRRLTDPRTADKDFLNMYKTALEMGRLTPTERERMPSPLSTSNQVTFNVYGLPGLEHLTTATQAIQQAVPQPTIVEAEVVSPTLPETTPTSTSNTLQADMEEW